MRLSRQAWHLVRWSAICLVLAAPVVAGVATRVQQSERLVSSIATERSGLRCALIDGDALAAIEEYRLSTLAAPGAAARTEQQAARALDTALHDLGGPACAGFLSGPRTSLAALGAAQQTMTAGRDEIAKSQASLPLANAALALLLDISDSSGLDYDSSVESVNLQDALMARILVGTERLQQGAQMLELAGRRHQLAPKDVVEVEKLSGEAHAENVMANDDFDGALFALPALSSTLNPARRVADRSEAALAAALDGAVTGSEPVRRADLTTIRRTSIAAGQRLMRTSARVLEASFDARVAAERSSTRFALAIGGVMILAAWAVAALLWQALRRRHRAELRHADERAQILETELARGNAERALRMTEQQFRAVFDGSDVGIAIVDRGDRIDANAALRSMFEDDLDLIAVKAAQMFAEVLGDRRDSYRTEHCFKKSDGEELWVDLSLSAVRGGSNDTVSAVVLVHDITEHKTLNARLDHETLHDALTGLPNRVQFIRRLSAMIGKGERFAVVFVDLDGFKAVNDALGHQAGDQVLRLAGYRLSTAVRPADLVARLHGDEFAVIIRDICVDDGSGEIEDIVGRLRLALDLSVDTPTTPLRVSASIGYVRDGATYRDAERLLHDADSAMYRSKINGRNRATAYEPAIGSSAGLRP
jgi:diguanylate cyclase (GGDEF)-like protein